ncbi:helix-turn-helix domain-containing protein [Leucobacter weissii]|uniref:Helix-turn-helix domain-containing protein n=1 Tax=Leucobacter weissii TaxID=1983706 RepID=A0A939S8G3_9MICO|nr:helix-turn-helix domain-containing protein [Leucobacter weissii]MBO1902051.1 helix-turn-helix domain-containing protein [Leucobacter weissii]
MNNERTSVAERAARHAALAEPARLRIVDLLALGDRSPSALRTELGLASNLLAHHLRVLERAGMIGRTRSEGDRRRSYLHLLPGAFEALLPSPVLAARRVVFVCTGNSARSPLAAALWERRSPIPATSAGTIPAPSVSAGAIAAAARHGLPFSPAPPRGLGELPAADDCLITVCDHAHERLRGSARLHWSIPNPSALGTDAAFDAAFERLARRVEELAPRVREPR